MIQLSFSSPKPPARPPSRPPRPRRRQSRRLRPLLQSNRISENEVFFNLNICAILVSISDFNNVVNLNTAP